MCKVCIFNRKLISQTWKVWGIITAINSFVVGLSNFEPTTKRILLIGLIIILVVIHVLLWIKANRINAKSITINETKINIRFGDIHQQDGIKVIAFNEYFDTIVDERIISSGTMHGAFLNEHPDIVPKIKEALRNSRHLEKRLVETNNARPRGNKKRYQLGSILRIDDYALVAFTPFNEENRAILSIPEYFAAMATFWSELKSECHDKPINLPLLGTGITRYSDGDGLRLQQALENTLQIAGTYNTHFQEKCEINIIIPLKNKSKINLYKLGN